MSESDGARRRCRGSSPAALTSLPDNDDLLREILLRLPPQPPSLPRASAVCRQWRRLATDPKFIVRFHAHHRKPPLLGVFEHLDQNIVFTPILDPPDRIPPRRFDLRIRHDRSFFAGGQLLGAQLLGCRHGRVLIMDKSRAQVLLCSPITGEQRRLPLPPGVNRFLLNGAAVCAAGDQGHVHGGCHSKPFKVVLVFSDTSSGLRRALACVYSSESGMWGDLISAKLPSPARCGCNASTLIGNILYWPFKFAMNVILAFDLDRQSLDVIKGPSGMKRSQIRQIIQAEDGAAGIAIFSSYSIRMWQRDVNCEGVTTWFLWKIVETHHILGIPLEIKIKGEWMDKFLGFDEDANAMFLCVSGSVYMVQLKSLHSKKVYETSYSNGKRCHPFSSFYTPGTTITGGGAEMLHDR